MALRNHKYHDDMYVNGIYLIHYIYTEGNKPNKGEFLCPYCGKKFITRISSVANGKTKSCGCQHKDNLKGQVFGLLTVIKEAPNQNGRTAWYCRCSCGNPQLIIAQSKLLKNGNVKSCGCLNHKPYNIKDLTGQKFGYLTVIRDSGKRQQDYDGQSNVLWECLCDCGNMVLVSGQMLKRGKTYSCGCKKECSKGEFKLRTILIDNNISFKEQWSFQDLINPKTGYKLRFDFFLPEFNILLEYDGLQHDLNYRPNSFYTEKDLKELHYRDSLKDNYCAEHNIPLIRISDRDYSLLSWKYLCTLINKIKIGGST